MASAATEALPIIVRSLVVFVFIVPGLIALVYLATGQNTSVLYGFLELYFVLLFLAALIWLAKRVPGT